VRQGRALQNVVFSRQDRRGSRQCLKCEHLVILRQYSLLSIATKRSDSENKTVGKSGTRQAHEYSRTAELLGWGWGWNFRYVEISKLFAFNVHSSVNRSYIRRVQPTICVVSLFIYFCKTLYMFQACFPSIISSSKLHILVQRQVAVRPILLPAATSQRRDFLHYKYCHLMLHREITQGESNVSIQRD